MNLIFDLDGTLTGPRVGITRSMNYALCQYGMPERREEELAKYIGPPLKDAFSNLTGIGDDHELLRLIAVHRERYCEVGLRENTA